MIPLTLAEIARVTGGSVADADEGLVVRGPAFLDSRSPEPAGLFVAISGDRADGHDFAPGAVDAGATAVLGSRPTGRPSVVVADPTAALGVLARHVLDRLDARVVALTGSQGKTATKDLLAAVLPTAGETVATSGNANNELGVPLTVLRAGASTRFLVVEMGARGIGHIAYLCRVAPPEIGIELNVGVAHLGEFGSREQIALAKGELVESLPAAGTAVLNLDDPLVAAMARRTQARVVGFGTGPGAAVRLGEVALDDLGRARFTLTAAGSTVPVSLRSLGAHQAHNAAAAAAAALVLGLDPADIGAALCDAQPASRWRMEAHDRADGLTVVNDAYNANPSSMRAALETLSAIGRRSGRGTVAVVGEMAELGEAAAAEHAGVGTLAHELGIGRVVVVGEAARPAYARLVQQRGRDGSTVWVGTTEEAVVWLRENVAGPDVVLVKASRAARLERVADALLVEEEGSR